MDSIGQDILSKLVWLSQRKQVCLQWIPSHVGMPGNEAADELAGRNFRYALPVTVSDEAGTVAIYQNSSDAVNIITPSMECSVSQSDIYGTRPSSVGDLCLAECVIDNGQKL
ncbi:hypothetical protein TNCV_3630591 [Trichonephila clavipes]|nr:hypothetical protein TNCV_3630591 [Trichonephila clavipes]